MVKAMKDVASLDVELTVEERNLLSVAYKNVIGARRASWRIISSIEQKEENKAAEDKLKMIKGYREQVWVILSHDMLWKNHAWSFPFSLTADSVALGVAVVFMMRVFLLIVSILTFQVEKELRDICSDILSVLDKHLIPCSDTGESKVFYYKMKGDYHRYLAEFATANDRKEAAENALVAYKAASDIAMTELATTHPIRYVMS